MSNDMKQDIEELLERCDEFYSNLMHYTGSTKDNILQAAYEVNEDLVKRDMTDGDKLALYLNGAMAILSHWSGKYEGRPNAEG